MKRILILPLILMHLSFHSVFSQNESQKGIPTTKKETIFLETGVNLSLPVHIEMNRTHGLAIGLNVRAGKKISEKWELGLRFDYDYRFAKTNTWDPPVESALQIRAAHRNFSLICLKPNIQFNTNSLWFFGAETGIGFVISDEDSKIGFGFVSEYDSREQFGSCSGLYLGKYFIIDKKKRKLGISLNLTNFLAEGHAENTLGLKFNYRFLN